MNKVFSRNQNKFSNIFKALQCFKRKFTKLSICVRNGEVSYTITPTGYQRPWFNKHFEFMDYGDVINALTETTILDSESAYYFYEECIDGNIFDDCKDYQEVCKVCVDRFNGFSEREQNLWRDC